jgi:16S rRNA (guanine527-N7)-methyltransferase
MTAMEGDVGTRLNRLLADAGLEPLDEETAARFSLYLSLILRWNARMNLTAVRDEDGILSRHFIESIALARILPSGISSLLDYGSGAGLPGVPIALCRPEIAVTLAESQGKKAAFLRETGQTLGLKFQVYQGRAELLEARFDCVALRAVDRMPEAVKAATGLLKSSGWLALLTTRAELRAMEEAAGAEFIWRDPTPLVGSEHRLIAIGQWSK